MPAKEAKPRRILVRGTNWIGDAVMMTPALRRLRASFPESRIALLATPRTTGLFQGSELFDEIIEYRRQTDGSKAFFQTVGLLREKRFDLAALFQNAFEAALLARLGGVPLRIGYAEQGRGWLLTHKLHRGPQHRNRHQIHDYLDIVAACELACGIAVPENPNLHQPPASLSASADQRSAATELLKRFNLEPSARPLIALNAAATNSRAKCWPVDRFAALADNLIKACNAQIILIGGPAERVQAQAVIDLMREPGAINLAGATTMGELIGLLDTCRLLISNDTGPAHIAAALGRPTLTIFGPTNEFETAPTGERAVIIRAEGIECARCMFRDCPIDHRCMTRISVEDVFQRARQWLTDNSIS